MSTNAMRPVWVGVVAGVVAACVAPCFYAGWIRLVGVDQMVPTLLMGPLVGLAVRLAAKPIQRAHVMAATILAALATLGGFVVGELLIYTPFVFQLTVGRLLSLMGILTVGGSIYIAYWIVSAGRRSASS